MTVPQEAQVVRITDRTRQKAKQAHELLYNVRDPKKYPEFDRVEREVIQAVVSLRLHTLRRGLTDMRDLLTENRRLSKELKMATQRVARLTKRVARLTRPKLPRKPRQRPVNEAATIIRRIAQRSAEKIA